MAIVKRQGFFFPVPFTAPPSVPTAVPGTTKGSKYLLIKWLISKWILNLRGKREQLFYVDLHIEIYFNNNKYIFFILFF